MPAREQHGHDLRLLCGCGHVPESRIGSARECWSGDTWAEELGRPLVRLLIDGRPCGGGCCWFVVAIMTAAVQALDSVETLADCALVISCLSSNV